MVIVRELPTSRSPRLQMFDSLHQVISDLACIADFASEFSAARPIKGLARDFSLECFEDRAQPAAERFNLISESEEGALNFLDRVALPQRRSLDRQ